MKTSAKPAVLAVLGVSILSVGAFQYQTEADRREYAALLKIKPSADAVELKIERSFPTAEQEEAGQYLNHPGAFIMDDQGRIYISDQKDDVVYRYDFNGEYLGQFGRKGQGPGDLSMPTHLQILGGEIAVNEFGNRRIQYFSLDGKPLRSVRRPHEYWNLAIFSDGRFVGAPLNEGLREESQLLEVVSPDGTIIRSFGEPVPFKYQQGSMNSRRILANADREVILFFRYLAIAQKYSHDGRLLWEKQIVTPFSQAKEQHNRRANSTLPDGRPGYRPIVWTVSILDGRYYITDQVGSRLWIWEMDEHLSIQRTFYAETGDIVYVSDMIPIQNGNRMTFFILGYKEDEGPKIHILVPIKPLGDDS